MAVLGGIVLQHTFSGVAGSNLTGTLIWVALAMVVAGSLRSSPGPPNSSLSKRRRGCRAGHGTVLLGQGPG